ncbi:PREDICTED: EF-hand domain-containing protein D2-like [Amphimedon queenslandica]|nr:PREDICTED: EF-hand domain-containing protein D2-like [Amphimedon queenslandica]|eukprot:XP_003388833.2 PREDICTED: EF-hand domain-containing protein D2-like [Amphimedon queenslandica]
MPPNKWVCRYTATSLEMAESELASKLNRQQQINDGEVKAAKVSQSVYAEFKEFSIQEIKEYRKIFVKYDVDKSGFIDFMELKLMMEKLGEPQTHLGLKAMIKEVDEDHDNQISFREFMLIFKKARDGTLEVDGLKAIAGSCDVAAEGVKGAKSFFEAKVNEQARGAKFEKEIKEEQEKKKKEAEEAAERKKAFKEKASMWH